MTNKTNEHNNNFILNQIQYFYITAPSKLTDDIFKSLPTLFVDRILKNGQMTISRLWFGYQKLIYGTTIINKYDKCIIEERKI